MSDGITMGRIAGPIISADPDRAACHAKGYAAMEDYKQRHPDAESLSVNTVTITNFPAPDGQTFDLHLMVIIVAEPQEGQA